MENEELLHVGDLLKPANWGKEGIFTSHVNQVSVTDGLQNSVYERKPSKPRKED